MKRTLHLATCLLYQSQNVDKFIKVWDDAGTGAPNPVSFFRPVPDHKTFLLGDIAQRGHISTPIFIHKPHFSVSESFSTSTLLAAPVDVKLLWNNKKVKGSGEFSIWQMIPPTGYVALGCIVNTSYTNKPDYRNYVCIHYSLVSETKFVYEADGNCLWSTQKTGSSWMNPVHWFGEEGVDGDGPDCSVWRSNNEHDLFYLSNTFTKPVCKVYTLSSDNNKRGSSKSDYEYDYEYDYETDDYEEINKRYEVKDVEKQPKQQKQQQKQKESWGKGDQEKNERDWSERTAAISIVPYNIDIKSAEEKFQEWRKGLWFAHPNFTGGENEQFHVVITPKFIPYYIYVVHVTTTFDIQATRVVHTVTSSGSNSKNNDQNHTNNNPNKNYEDVQREKNHHRKCKRDKCHRKCRYNNVKQVDHGDHIQTTTHSANHSGVRDTRYEGNSNNFLRRVAVTHLSPVSDQSPHSAKISKSMSAIVAPTIQDQKPIPVYAFAAIDRNWDLSQASLGVTDPRAIEVTGLKDWMTVFNTEVSPRIISAEKNKLEAEALSQVHGIGNTSITSSTIHTAVRAVDPTIVHLPIYIIQYEYCGKKHMCFLNGQTGEICEGQEGRPYSLGFVSGLLSKISVFGQAHEQVEFVTGKTLRERDEVEGGVYEEEKWYLVWPGSGGLMLWKGWISLRNDGEEDVELVSVRRGGKGGIEASFLLRAGEEERFEYWGWWAIGIESGDVMNLKVKDLQRYGGLGPDANKLLMG